MSYFLETSTNGKQTKTETHRETNSQKKRQKQKQKLKNEYLNKIKKILSYIKAGDIFQVNFTQRFKSKIPKNFSLIQYYYS